MTSEVAARAGHAVADAAPTRRGSTIRVRAARCFACGELNEHGLHLDLHVDGDRCWTELALPDRFQGWDGIAHGGIVCTILDEVMAWSVIGTRQLGRHRPAERRLQAAGPARPADPRRRLGHRDAPARVVETAGRIVDAATGEVLATAEAMYVAADAEQPSASSRSATASGRRRRGASATPAATAAPHREPARLSPITAQAIAFVAERRPARRGARSPSSPSDLDDPDAFARAARAGLRGARRSGLSRGPASHRARDRPDPRRPLAAHRGRERGFRERHGGSARPTWLFVADRLLREPELEPRWFAFGLLERLMVDDPERTWQLLRRAAARRATGSRSTPSPTPSEGHPPEPYRWAELEQLVYCPSRWERRLVGSTIATMPVRRPPARPRSRGRRSTDSGSSAT